MLPTVTDTIPLSIIIPVYNKAEYVDRCLHSILEQDYTNFELIIIDDGSTDESANIIKQFTDSRIIFISTANKGVSAARNRGMTEAKGQYLLFVDSDDYISPHYLSHIMQASSCRLCLHRSSSCSRFSASRTRIL